MKKIKEWVPPIILFTIIGIVFLIQRGRITNLQQDLYKSQAITGNLAEDIVSVSTVSDNILTKISRINGTDSVIVETQYVPVESEIQYITRIDTVAMGQLEQAQLLLAQLEQQMKTVADSVKVDSLRTAIMNIQRMLTITEVEFDTHGLTLSPSIGVGLNVESDIEYSGMFRFYYWNRWGANVYVGYSDTEDITVGGAIDYRIPGMENTSGRIGIGHNCTDDKLGGFVGIGVYF